MNDPQPSPGPTIEIPAGPALRLGQLFPVAPLFAALLASVVAYWPALRAPFYADDYLYLRASRELSFAEYARASLTPLSDEPLLSSVTAFFWRPLYYLSFGLIEPLLGGRATAYHLLLLGIHLSSVALVWLLARQLTGRWEPAGVAAILFAAHPAAFEGVAWISSLSNVGLPLMLGAWLAFARATQAEAVRWRLVALSALLVAVALGFRESTIAVVPAMAAWRLLWWRRHQLREWTTYSPFIPFAVVLLVYELLRTRFLTEPAVNSAVWDLGSHTPGQFWYYLKVAAMPVDAGATGFVHGLQVAAGAILLAALPVLLVFRRWLPAALLAGFLISIAPYAPLTLAVSQRYAYFPVAFLALAVAAVFRQALDSARTRIAPRILAPAIALPLGVLLILGTVETNHRTRDWVESGPEVQQAWVDELQAAYPTLPPGGTLYCANTPLILALFGDALLRPTVGFYYPGVRAERFDIADLARVEAALGPDDRIFVPGATPARK